VNIAALMPGMKHSEEKSEEKSEDDENLPEMVPLTSVVENSGVHSDISAQSRIAAVSSMARASAELMGRYRGAGMIQTSNSNLEKSQRAFSRSLPALRKRGSTMK